MQVSASSLVVPCPRLQFIRLTSLVTCEHCALLVVSLQITGSYPKLRKHLISETFFFFKDGKYEYCVVKVRRLENPVSLKCILSCFPSYEFYKHQETQLIESKSWKDLGLFHEQRGEKCSCRLGHNLGDFTLTWQQSPQGG